MLRRINIALLVLQWTVCMAGGKEEAGTWQYVTASNPPAERVAPAVIDAQQRIWIFGGLRYAGRYQGVYKGTAFFNDLHYFDTQARAWHEVTASNAPSERNGHTSVIDAQQRIWVFGGYFYSARFNDLHYFDMQAKVWHEVSAQNAPPGRSYHTAVMDAKQRMWIFGGDRPPGQGGYNDLHYFDIQANTWQEVKASNPPSRRSQHTVVMDAQQQMWIFGDYGGSGTLHYFDIQAKTWQEVKASNAPSKTEGHTAVMDAQQRMWIFGGYNGNANDLHYFDIQAKTWQQVSASNPFERYYHAAVMDMQQRMWIFGGNADDDDGTRSWNDLRYFDTQASSSTSASTSASTSTTYEDMTSRSTSTSSKKVALADSMQPQAEDAWLCW